MDKQRTNPGWEERAERLCDPANFVVEVTNLPLKGLTPAEQYRLCKKLRLVEQFAARLAANMLKGVVKYPSDEMTVEEWEAAEEDDTVDSINYRLLAADARQRGNQPPTFSHTHVHSDRECSPRYHAFWG